MEKEYEEIQKVKKQIKNDIEHHQKNLISINSNNAKENNIKDNQDKLKKCNDLQSDIKIAPLSEYTSSSLIGLNNFDNINAVCFMNSTLQCLSQTKRLTDYFLNNKNLNRIMDNNIALKNRNELQLCPIYLDLINKLWAKNENKSFSPNKFMETIVKMNQLFKQNQSGDYKNFIIFILEQFHKELKKPVKKQSNNIDKKLPLNQYDKKNALNYFIDEFKEETSVISDIFFGVHETTNVCLNCKNNFNSKGLNDPIYYNYVIFNCLIFPLEDIIKMKNNFINNNELYMNNNRLSIY